MARRSKKNTKAETAESQMDTTEKDVVEETTDQNEEVSEEQTTEEEVDFQAKFNEMNDKFLRLYSEFENFRRRTAKERIDLLGNAKGEALKGVIPVIDDFERAIINNEQTAEAEPLKEGFKLIHSKLSALLTQSGMKVMETSAGDPFDTDKHEAVTQIPAPSDDLKGKVVDVIEKGYVINDKVIRYAKVVIGS